VGRIGWIYGLHLNFGKSGQESQQIVANAHEDDQVASINPFNHQKWVVRDSNPNRGYVLTWSTYGCN